MSKTFSSGIHNSSSL